jgi:hypothetical protein
MSQNRPQNAPKTGPKSLFFGGPSSQNQRARFGNGEDFADRGHF